MSDLLATYLPYITTLINPDPTLSLNELLIFLSTVDRVRTNGNELPSTEILHLFPNIEDLVITKYKFPTIVLSEFKNLKTLNLSHGSLEILPDLTPFPLQTLDVRQTKLTKIESEKLPETLKYLHSDLETFKLKELFDRGIRIFTNLFTEVYYEQEVIQQDSNLENSQLLQSMQKQIQELVKKVDSQQFQIELLMQLVKSK
ncbi:hypothetical protein SS50377_26764 [Spironucleus salmonicida]|uniref:Leucine rich repeat-containing protein n=1 Tax=Spironucleus salmonicida TaxID=348837 RepID=V6LYC1_9EUKA|nr:hypothetical protein SS50377_26764 [Spironucleus salmonicida]|eukprot:EST49233.1 Hypothetical protein SS50377_10453 [Spironucleus salmonicida]